MRMGSTQHLTPNRIPTQLSNGLAIQKHAREAIGARPTNRANRLEPAGQSNCGREGRQQAVILAAAQNPASSKSRSLCRITVGKRLCRALDSRLETEERGALNTQNHV